MVLIECGEVGCWGLLGRVAWPFVAMTTIASVFVMVETPGREYCVENRWVNEDEPCSEDYNTEDDCSDEAGTTSDDDSTDEEEALADEKEALADEEERRNIRIQALLMLRRSVKQSSRTCHKTKFSRF